jgi:type IV pilus assembly protein PilQ
MNKLAFTFVIMLFSSYTLLAQNRFDTLDAKLTKLADSIPGLYSKVDLSVSGVTIQEFVRAIAINNQINIAIEPALNIQVINNFSNVPVKDVLVFLCRNYKLDLSISGTIISLTTYAEPALSVKITQPNIPKITWEEKDSLISLDLRFDSIDIVAKHVAMLTGKNIIVDPRLSNQLMRGYIRQMPLESALLNIAIANGIELENKGSGVFLLKKPDQATSENLKPNKYGSNAQDTKEQKGNEIAIQYNGLLDVSISADNADIKTILFSLCKNAGVNYFLFREPEGKTTLYVQHVTFTQLLDHLLAQTSCTFRVEEDIYIIGDRASLPMAKAKVIQLQHRSVIEIVQYIPDGLKKGMDIKEFTDLNCLIVCGPESSIDILESFIRQIDQIVPLVLIEVLIVDQKSDFTIATGLSIGLGSSGFTQTKGQVLPGIDLQFTSESINNLINSFNGLGIFNLGKVTPQFYASLKAMEDQGMLKMRSTPQLATMNGYEANMSIGTTTYYIEEKTNFIGVENPQVESSKTYKSISADFSLTIKPIVSGDEQITMNILVQQSDFTTKISNEAPPGQETRSFSSSIRVKNGEMVLLGGLEKKTDSESSSGLPLLSRIPILKWIFSNRKKEASKSKLSIFIKPTVIY